MRKIDRERERRLNWIPNCYYELGLWALVRYVILIFFVNKMTNIVNSVYTKIMTCDEMGPTYENDRACRPHQSFKTARI